MRRILGVSTLCILLTAPCSEEPAQAMNAVTPYVLQVRAWTFTALRTSAARRRVSGRQARLLANVVSLDRETALVQPGLALTLDVPAGFNQFDPTSLEVRSGCLTYDFGLYPNDAYVAGEELLLYQGQSLNLVDRAPPMLRDDDLTGEIHAKFWNRGEMGCTFRLLLTGRGF